MKLFIPKDIFTNPRPPRLFLCTTGKKIIQELPSYDETLDGKWGSYSEASFSIDRQYVDVLTGEVKVHPTFDKAEGLRKVYMENIGYFVIQDPDTTYGEKDSKTLSCFSSEYETANKYLENFRINTGEIDSKEVIYLESVYGYNYTIDQDNLYKKASGTFDIYESYYVKEYTDNDSYTYEQAQIADASEYAKYNGSTVAKTLYIKSYPNVRFYWPTKPELSLVHLVLEKIPGWTIKDVDVSLWRKERKFDEDRITVYDFLMNEVQDTFKCVVDWNTETNQISFYEEAEDGITEDNTVQTRWETDVFISRENLANEININYSTDDIKTKLKVSGSDDLDIREVNLGKNYIMNLSYYHNSDWMEQDLLEAYDDYLDIVEEYSPKYTQAMQNFVGAYNKWNDLMNAVPADGNVVLVGDDFEKLYCTYTPINTAYSKQTFTSATIGTTIDTLYSDEACTKVIDESLLADEDTFVVQGYAFIYQSSSKKFKCERYVTETTATQTLKDKLRLYHVDDDIKASVSDNILLRLKNNDSDIATIRIYDPKQKASGSYDENAEYYTYSSKNDKYTWVKISDEATYKTYDKSTEEKTLYTNNYKIQVIIVGAQSGIESDPDTYSIDDWIKGNLTAKKMGLVKYDNGSLVYDNNGNTIPDYTVQYIGTMGAYLVLAKDETVKANLQDYGVKLLQEKHDTYTTVFQTQTESMFSNENYQCVVSDDQPTGNLPKNTRWLNTNSNPIKLYQYQSGEWTEISAEVSTDDQKNYENYQRYIDNYDKLKAVQEVLVIKEKQATYMNDGYAISNRRIDYDLYTRQYDDHEDGVIDDKDTLRYKGQTLEGDMYRAAEAHFVGHTVTRSAMDQNVPIYYFTTSYDPVTYVQNTKSYNDKMTYYVYRYYYPYFIKNATEFSKQTLYVETSAHSNVYEKATTYNAAKKYYIKLDSPYYAIVDIDSQETFNKYDKSTDEKTLYTMTGGHLFAVYLKGTTPYVSYADSRGVYQATMDWISKKTDFENFFDDDKWIRLSPFIREDEFSDSNFLLTGYESEEERLEICQELFDSANKELNTLCQPSLEFSMDMDNILALPEFHSLVDQFQLGNFVRVHIRDGLVKRARLLEVHLNFSDLSDFSCDFGNLVTTKSEVDKHAELLSQAVTAGKQVATSAGDWQRAVDKSNSLEEEIANGLQNAAIQVGRANGQAISWDEHGFRCRKLVDGTTDQYLDEQIAIINNKIVFTNDGWKTSKAALGEFKVDINGDGSEETMYGLLADAVVSGYVKGSVIEGGSLKIGGTGGTFIVHEDGSVQILAADAKTPIYATKSDVDLVNKAIQYRVELFYDKSTIFGAPGQSCTLTCEVYKGNDKITSKLPSGTVFSWLRNGTVYKTTSSPELTVTNADIDRNAIFSCSITFDETKIK